MKFLGIDTSGARLCVIAVNGDTVIKSYGDDCPQTHSVRLMGEIDNVLARARMSARECDFFACVVGPGSFTGIRIGISTVKGLCFALEKPALAVTSLDTLAYAESGAKSLALVDALHGNYYACGYGENRAVEIPPAFITSEQAAEIEAKGYVRTTVATADVAEGLYRAVTAKQKELINAKELAAVYLRKSSAEGNA